MIPSLVCDVFNRCHCSGGKRRIPPPPLRPIRLHSSAAAVVIPRRFRFPPVHPNEADLTMAGREVDGTTIPAGPPPERPRAPKWEKLGLAPSSAPPGVAVQQRLQRPPPLPPPVGTGLPSQVFPARHLPPGDPRFVAHVVECSGLVGGSSSCSQTSWQKNTRFEQKNQKR